VAGLSNRAHEGEKRGCQKCQNQKKMMRKAEKKSHSSGKILGKEIERKGWLAVRH